MGPWGRKRAQAAAKVIWTGCLEYDAVVTLVITWDRWTPREMLMRKPSVLHHLCPFPAKLNWPKISHLFKRQGMDGAGERPDRCTLPGLHPWEPGGDRGSLGRTYLLKSSPGGKLLSLWTSYYFSECLVLLPSLKQSYNICLVGTWWCQQRISWLTALR